MQQKKHYFEAKKHCFEEEKTRWIVLIIKKVF